MPQPLGGLAQELLDAPMLGLVDGARPPRLAPGAAARQQLSLLEVDVTLEALLVLLEQPCRIRPPALDQGLLMARKEIAQGNMLPEEPLDRIGVAVHVRYKVAGTAPATP